MVINESMIIEPIKSLSTCFSNKDMRILHLVIVGRNGYCIVVKFSVCFFIKKKHQIWNLKKNEHQINKLQDDHECELYNWIHKLANLWKRDNWTKWSNCSI